MTVLVVFGSLCVIILCALMKDVVVLVGDPKFVRCQPFYSQSAIELSVEGDVCVCFSWCGHQKLNRRR